MGSVSPVNYHIEYRADVDSLRAVSVISVLLFHYFPNIVGGGYVGVDVFFVISGFIITKLIQSEIGRGVFTISSFYERRIKRILPAYFMVIISSLVVSYFILLPVDFVAFSKSMVSSSLMIPNIYFYNESGYFDAAAHTKPLLHMWSLGVEEQFYILFPLILLGTMRMGRGAVLWGIGGISLMSFMASVWGVVQSPTMAFYLLPFRAWELGLGSVLALAGHRLPVLTLHQSRLVLLLGLAGILLPAFLYSSATPFPGAAALLPCIGAVLTLYSGANATIPHPLRSPGLSYIGRISFGLYIWHWPILIFMGTALGRALTPFELSAGLALSLVCAAFSYHVVEGPIRRTATIGKAACFLLAAAAVAVTVTVGTVIQKSDGFPERLPQDVIALANGAKDLPTAWDRCHALTPESIRNGRLCLLGDTQAGGPAQFILWGDSHAHALMPALDTRARAMGVTGYAASHTGCPPLVGAYRQDPNAQACIRFNQAMMDWIKASDVTVVVFSAFWSVYVDGWPEDWQDAATLAPMVLATADGAAQDREGRDRIFRRAFAATVADLQAAGKTVWVVKQVPSVFTEVPAYLARRRLAGYGLPPLKQVEEMHRRRLDPLYAFFRTLQVGFVDPAEKLCSSSGCAVAHDGRSLYSDRSHLSVTGALHVSPVLDPILDKSIGPQPGR